MLKKCTNQQCQSDYDDKYRACSYCGTYYGRSNPPFVRRSYIQASIIIGIILLIAILCFVLVINTRSDLSFLVAIDVTDTPPPTLTHTPLPTLTHTPLPTLTHIPPPTLANVQLNATVFTNGQDLFVRSGPGTHHAVIRRLSNDTYVTLVGRNRDSSWFMLSDGGWVYSGYLFVNGSRSRLAIVDNTLNPTSIPTVRIESNLAYGDVIPDSVGRDEIDHWSFYGTQGDVIAIGMLKTSDTLDPYLTLLNNNGVILMTDDDRAGNLNARIFNYRLPYTGYYHLEASSYGDTFGDYRLSIWKIDSSQSLARLDQAYQGSITQGKNQIWVFDAQANTHLTMTVSAINNAFDTFMILWDSNGQIIDFNDDIIMGRITNSQLDILLTTKTSYYLEIQDFDNTRWGRYEVMLQLYNTNRPVINEVIQDGDCSHFEIVVNVTDNQNDLNRVEILKQDNNNIILNTITRLHGNNYRVTQQDNTWYCQHETCTDYLQAVDNAGNRSNIYVFVVQCNQSG
jgi:uncharacterized protein YraI